MTHRFLKSTVAAGHVRDSLLLIPFPILDLPTWQTGDPSYGFTYVIAFSMAIVILGVCLAAALRRGNGTFRKKKSAS